ncbi:major facilitator superfamily domain-containing protein [Crepidotus variabilis]|uniref:Major facilitator superfamily domain-containing protein n=1 Tax=Crepidotus variabilis TaxID=179855 RepID=A0A9P6EHT9_9AGAR|nr:major facilitator superfamily domain-containing protein [Crepidotus variabilis]
MGRVAEIWASFSAAEKRNIFFYIAGIMMYKLGLEFFNGSIATLASDRFTTERAFQKLGAAQGIQQAAQCVGAILIAPLVKRWPTRTVLATSIFVFALMTTILLIVDGSTGGKIKPSSASKPVYGHWNPNLIFVVWTLSGISYGMVELIRRVIPADIVGGNVSKLRRMDATVHIFYEVAGTAGAFASSSAISRLGNNYSFLLTPVFFVAAGCIWFVISSLNFSSTEAIKQELEQQGLANVDKGTKANNYLVQIFHGVVHFGQSVYLGSKLVLTNRRFIWLLPSYALALFMHRFLESTLAVAFAKRTLGTSAWSQIIVGGSNFGELLGAATVLVLSDVVTTPLPWLRLDAVALNLVWVLPSFATRAQKDVSWAWRVAGSFIPISFGWAAGDVSLAAYIQSALSDSAFSHKNISALGAVMAFLYSTYIVLNAVLSYLLGKVLDDDFTQHKNILYALKMVGGVHFSVASVIILASTLIPLGAIALNPKALGTIGAPTQAPSTDSEDELKKTDVTEQAHIDRPVVEYQ